MSRTAKTLPTELRVGHPAQTHVPSLTKESKHKCSAAALTSISRSAVDLPNVATTLREWGHYQISEVPSICIPGLLNAIRSVPVIWPLYLIAVNSPSSCRQGSGYEIEDCIYGLSDSRYAPALGHLEDRSR